MATTPDLFSLQGQLTHDRLETEVDAVIEGRYPGWRMVHENIGVEMVRSQGRAQTSWLGLGNVGEALTPSSGQLPERVWVIVLEEDATRRREVVKFMCVGGADEHEQPIWARIRADASMPVQGQGQPDDDQGQGQPDDEYQELPE